MLFRDPPQHTRLRGAVSRLFTPRVVEALRPRVWAHVDALLDRAAAAGRMDVVADLAEPLPRAVMGELLGIPEASWPACAAWSAAVARSLDALPVPGDWPLVAEGEAARRALGAALHERVCLSRQLARALPRCAVPGRSVSNEPASPRATSQLVMRWMSMSLMIRSPRERTASRVVVKTRRVTSRFSICRCDDVL
jgi:cytochrome P450